MQAAWSVRHSVMAEGGAGFALQNYDVLQAMLWLHRARRRHGAGDGGSRHLKEIAKTLEEIDALHKQSLRRGGGTARDRPLRVARFCLPNWNRNCQG